MRRRAALLALALAACGLAGSAAAHPGHGPPLVRISDTQYKPARLQVTAGDLVEWRWDGPDTNHSVTADQGQSESFDSDEGKGPLEVGHRVGDRFTYFFAKPGTYAYHCKVHSSMHGTIVVGKPASVDRKRPRLRRVEATVKGNRAVITFRVNERVSVTAKVRRPPARKVLRDSFAFAKRGRGRTKVSLAGLKAGRYAIALRAEDDTGNRSRVVRTRVRR